MNTCNQLSIDVEGLFKAIQDECYALIWKTAELIKVEFAAYIAIGGAGRNIWREHAAKEFNIISATMANDLVEAKLGLPENIESEARFDNYLAQIMVAVYGNHGPLYTKPGQITFHDHMEDRRRSEAKSVWALPEGFNWEDPQANKMLETAMKIIGTYFKDGVNSLLRNINFYDYVYVK